MLHTTGSEINNDKSGYSADDLYDHESIAIKHLFLVGGFAESPILQEAIRKEFGRIMKVIIPQVIFGLGFCSGYFYQPRRQLQASQSENPYQGG